MARFAYSVALALVACGDPAPEAEVVVRDASLGGLAPTVMGATASSVLWVGGGNATMHLGGASLATLVHSPSMTSGSVVVRIQTRNSAR